MATLIPILDEQSRILAWTKTPPTFVAGCGLKHQQAEALLGFGITCKMVVLSGDDAEQAGAPLGMRDRWHCFAIVPDTNIANAARPEHRDEARAVDATPIRILFVEDDEGFRHAAGRVMRNAGFRVTVAADYVSALAALDGDQHINLLLTDIVMANGVNGFALGRMARMRRRGLPILYVTAYQVPLDEALGKVLRKPVAPDRLVAEIGAMIGMSA